MTKEKEYIAVELGYNTNVIYGTLAEILTEMVDQEIDPDEYKFFPMESQVKVKYERKLTLAED